MILSPINYKRLNVSLINKLIVIYHDKKNRDLNITSIGPWITFIVKHFRVKAIWDREYWENHRILVRMLFIYIKYNLFNNTLYFTFPTFQIRLYLLSLFIRPMFIAIAKLLRYHGLRYLAGRVSYLFNSGLEVKIHVWSVTKWAIFLITGLGLKLAVP